MKDIYGKEIKNLLGENLTLESLVSSPIILLKERNLQMRKSGFQKKKIEFFNELEGRVLSIDESQLKFIHDSNGKSIYPIVSLKQNKPFFYFNNGVDVEGSLFVGLGDNYGFFVEDYSSILKVFKKVEIEDSLDKHKEFFEQSKLPAGYVSAVYDRSGFMVWPKSSYE
ncbi:MAG: hypothetical protein PHT94_01360 [Candidatus Nanoarchaeia archaeon]|nr:hypothetical protein [Candidatus Nanoarchaeia archaeon]